MADPRTPLDRSASLLIISLLLAGCAAATPAGSANGSAASGSASQNEPTPDPTLASTTVEANEAPPGAISIVMAQYLRFIPDAVTAKAGTVVFFLRNDSGGDVEVHDFVIGRALHEPLARTPHVEHGKAVVFTVEGLTPGTYTFWCSIRAGDDDHAWYGMKGTLTVTS